MSENRQESKALGHDDSSGFAFIKRVLKDNPTAAINFDRLQKTPDGQYIIFELLKCDEGQFVSPYTSHPSRYWNKNARKFLSLWRASQDFHAKLYLVNYADVNTKYSDQVLLIEVQDMDENGITSQKITKHTIDTFSEWFVKTNNFCLEPIEKLIEDIYKNKSREELGKITLKNGKYKGSTISEIAKTNINYLEWLSGTKYNYSLAAKYYLNIIKTEG